MKPAVLLVAVALGSVACAGSSPEAAATRSTPPPAVAQDAQAAPSREALIYAAVIKRLVTKDHTFGARRSPFEVVYVVDGTVPGAGDPLEDHLTPRRPFRSGVIEGIREQLGDGIPPLRLVDDGRDALRRPFRSGTVANDGVLVSLGPIERKNGRVHVPTTLSCGGKCGQWLTYVLSERNGRWVVTRSGPVTIS